mmetsp:Transcript_12715/g.40713  ORF Transcript_12715/g.40713 Transcript_12715/m.40713 type:complete len:266 (+) Transcript_12715:70-867(+)
MSTVITSPAVSRPSESGVTSSSSRSFVSSPPSPERMPPWTAAPKATASSGLMPLLGSLPLKKSLSSCRTFGMRVEPPTRTISSTSRLLTLASVSTRCTGARVALKRSAHSSSNLARVTVSEKSRPAASDSTSKRAEVSDDSARFVRSASRRSLALAEGEVTVAPGCFLACRPSRYSTSRLSRSSPPRCVSPAVARTSKTPASMERSDTSNVPPPKSNTSTFAPESLERSRPYASAAAVGSFRIRITFSPAMVPASLVACRWPSLK